MDLFMQPRSTLAVVQSRNIRGFKNESQPRLSIRRFFASGIGRNSLILSRKKSASAALSISWLKMMSRISLGRCGSGLLIVMSTRPDVSGASSEVVLSIVICLSSSTEVEYDKWSKLRRSYRADDRLRIVLGDSKSYQCEKYVVIYASSQTGRSAEQLASGRSSQSFMSRNECRPAPLSGTETMYRLDPEMTGPQQCCSLSAQLSRKGELYGMVKAMKF